jgi:hypothetical protein
MERDLTVAETKSNALEEVVSRVRELMRDVERLINPQAQKPARVPVPVPVRQPQRPQRGSYDPYR